MNIFCKIVLKDVCFAITFILFFFRFALRYDTASATYTLQLKDVQRSDEGRYECQIIVGINNKVN